MENDSATRKRPQKQQTVKSNVCGGNQTLQDEIKVNKFFVLT